MATRTICPGRSAGIPALLVAAVLLAARVPRASGQAPRRADSCQAGESWQACYDRATQVVLGEVKVARTRHDTLQQSRLLRGLIPMMSRACTGGSLGPACYFAGRLTLAFSINDAAAQRRSADLFETGCLAGSTPSAAACNGLGDAFAYGLGRASRADSAMFYFHRGCINGNATACARAASRYVQEPELGPAAADSTDRLWRLGCTGGSAIGCVGLAAILFAQLDTLTPERLGKHRYEQLRDSAIALDSLGCWSGSRVGCNRYAFDFTRPLGRANMDSARFYYEIACADSVPFSRVAPKRPYPVMRGRQMQGQGCDNLADLLSIDPSPLSPYVLASGRRISPPDPALALTYYRLGCSAMEPAACVDMARNDSSLSTTERLFLFATACLNGSGYGCDNAGLQLSTFFVDSTSAGNYLYRSCQLGDPNGCNNLGVLKERSDSEGVALKYYRQACEASNSFGCNNLALRLEFGYHSPELAVGYYARACELRTLDSCRRAIAAFDKLGRFDEEARYRTIACQLFASECKRKT